MNEHQSNEISQNAFQESRAIQFALAKEKFSKKDCVTVAVLLLLREI